MKKFLLFSGCLFCFNVAVAQLQDAWVFFNAKPTFTYPLTNPIAFLSQEAIDRKTLHNTAIDLRDVPVDESFISSLKNQPGIQVMAKSKWMNAAHIRGLEADINQLLTLSFVDSIDFADASLNRSQLRLDTKSPVALNMTAPIDHGLAFNQLDLIELDSLHQLGFTGTGIKIAILDSGFPNIDVLNGFNRTLTNQLILGGYDFVDREAVIFDDHQHGSHVSSHITGYVLNSYVGAAPDASLYLFRTEDVSSENPVEESYWVEAAERADSLGVHIINTSLGYLIYDNPAYSYSYSDMDGQTSFIARGTNIAAEKGLLVVVSSGNSGSSSVHPYIHTPADALGAFTIGAVDSSGNYASFSSIGPTYDGRTKPDVVAQGQSTYYINQQDQIVTGSGTSFSAPIISGAIACLWEALPSLNAEEIKNLVKESASLYPNPTNFLGYGIPNFALAQTLSVEEVTPDSPIKTWPNPFTERVHIELIDEQPYELAIFNNLGQLILERSGAEKRILIHTEQLPGGMYLLRLKLKQGVKTFKLVKL
ncbi:MAG: S8 family serine peptidase [Flavobacteriaceae bacterium]|nr:S8 family serine peptidase [Flavobacteriaceae bacterium]